MAKILVLYYSAYGHIEKMAQAVAVGARQGGVTVDIKRVPATVPESWGTRNDAVFDHHQLASLRHGGGIGLGHAGQMILNEITAGSPHGATTIAGSEGSRQPTENERVRARYQRRKIAETAGKLAQ